MTIGQYYLLVNIDKEEFLHPHDLHAGLKAVEIASSNVPKLLAYLLTSSTGAGGGDFKSPDDAEYEGRWAGDRIAIAGDYDESGLGVSENVERDQDHSNLYHKADAEFDNISAPAMAEYNQAVPDHMQLTQPLYERDVTLTVVGTHPDDPRTLAEGVSYHEAREYTAEYAQEYGRGFIEYHEADDLTE